MYSVLYKLINFFKSLFKSNQIIDLSVYIYFLVHLSLFIFYYVIFHSEIEYIYVDDYYFIDVSSTCWIEPDWSGVICLFYMLTDMSMDSYLDDVIEKGKTIIRYITKKYGTLCYLKRRFIREFRKNEYVVHYTSFKFRYELKEKIKYHIYGILFYYIPHAMFFIMASSVALLIGYFIFARMFMHIPMIDKILVDFLNQEVGHAIPKEEIPTEENSHDVSHETKNDDK